VSKKLRTHAEGAPFQPGDAVVVVAATDRDIYDVSALIGQRGHVDYRCGCCSMVGVRFDGGGPVDEFWPDELALLPCPGESGLARAMDGAYHAGPWPTDMRLRQARGENFELTGRLMFFGCFLSWSTVEARIRVEMTKPDGSWGSS